MIRVPETMAQAKILEKQTLAEEMSEFEPGT
jgi:hypothetical protein